MPPQPPSAPGVTPNVIDLRQHGWAASVGGGTRALSTLVNAINDHRIMAEAAAVTYFTLLAIFPALASLISLYGLVANPASIGASLDSLSTLLPAGGMQIVSGQIDALISAPQQALGIGALIGLLTSLWSANAGVKSLFDALNVVYGLRETRGFLHRTLLSMAFTLGALLFVVLAVGAVVAIPVLLHTLGFSVAGTNWLRLGRWPVLVCALAVFLALTYRYGPCHPRESWHWLTWGSVFAAFVWIAASAAFSWYVASFGSFNKTYGSLGAVVGFMTWIWLSTMIVLVGAELNVAMEKKAVLF